MLTDSHKNWTYSLLEFYVNWTFKFQDVATQGTSSILYAELLK